MQCVNKLHIVTVLVANINIVKMELRVYIYIATVGCLTLEVRSKLTVDLVFRLLNDRFDNLAIEMYALRSELETINDRIDNIELLSKSQPEQETDGPRDPGEGNDKVDQINLKQTEERIRKAFISEKKFVRKFLAAYEGKFVKFQKTVTDAISFMNTSTEETRSNASINLENTVNKVSPSPKVKHVEYDLDTTIEHKVKEIIGDIRSQSSSIDNLDTRISTLENKRVGFTARLPESYVVNRAVVLPFSDVRSNYGGGFDNSTGYFTAPTSGLYLFYFNAEALLVGSAHVSLYVDGKVVISALVHIGPNRSGSNAAVVFMSVGQIAFVASANLEDKYYLGRARTSFSGVLIN